MRPSMTHIALHVADMAQSIDFYQRYCHMQIIHSRGCEPNTVIWMAEPARSAEMVFVFVSGGQTRPQSERDYSHLGFALESKEAVDKVAEMAKAEQRLVWPPTQEPWPVGYYCAIRDPNGKLVEFSYGQPLGPGSQQMPPSTV